MSLNLEKEEKMSIERNDEKISNKKGKKVAKKHKVEN
jgi:hypothetical protein